MYIHTHIHKLSLSLTHTHTHTHTHFHKQKVLNPGSIKVREQANIVYLRLGPFNLPFIIPAACQQPLPLKAQLNVIDSFSSQHLNQ